eukprot:evm.model.NODE_44373_length_11135_cov_15.448496.2
MADDATANGGEPMSKSALKKKMKYFEARLRMVAELEANGTSAYPHKYHTTQSIPDFVQAYQGLEPGTK